MNEISIEITQAGKYKSKDPKRMKEVLEKIAQMKRLQSQVEA